MEPVLDALIREGKLLLQRVRLHYTSPPEQLGIDTQVIAAELEAWYNGVETLLDKTFGSNSDELGQWRETRSDTVRRSREAFGTPQSESFVVQLLAESIGILVEIGISRLEPQRTVRETVGFQSFHPALGRTAGLFATGEYDLAVFVAFKTVEEAVRSRTNADPTDIGVNLISKAMAGKSPKLRLSNIAAEQEAYHQLFCGAIGAFKNPLSHRSGLYTDPARVLKLLALASSLLDLLIEKSMIPRVSHEAEDRGLATAIAGRAREIANQALHSRA